MLRGLSAGIYEGSIVPGRPGFQPEWHRRAPLMYELAMYHAQPDGALIGHGINPKTKSRHIRHAPDYERVSFTAARCSRYRRPVRGQAVPD